MPGHTDETAQLQTRLRQLRHLAGGRAGKSWPDSGSKAVRRFSYCQK